MRLILVIVFLLIPICTYSGHLKPEKWYQDKWCTEQGGQTEHVLPDRTRCDCLTDSHAVEIDFASNFYEALGQALYYAMHTGLKAGILLIIEKESDIKYWDRLNQLVKYHNLPVDCWRIDYSD